MKFKNHLISVLTLILLLPACLSAQSLPVPRNYVADRASVINQGTESRLNALLKDVERKTSVQMIILTVPSTDGIAIEKYSIDLATRWQLGQKGKDNGILFVLAVRDRKYRIEVGYGLEAVLPDSFVGTVGRQQLVPYLKSGDYSAGVLQATSAILKKLGAEYDVQFSGMSRVARQPYQRRRRRNPIASLIGFIFLVIIFALMPRRMRNFLLLYMILGGGRGGRYGGGGGFGGFGGFGGGGGGSFGGGGASGGW